MMKRWLRLTAALAILLGAAPMPGRAQDAPPTPLRIDTNHSTIGFSVPIVGGLSQVTGKFTDFDVRLFWDEADLAASSVEATIQITSIDTGLDDRDSDLRSDNFFDAATYPTITFVSDHFERADDGYLAHGTLTMKGVARQIALPFQVVTQAQSDGGAWTAFTVAYTLDRTDYGITWEHSLVPFFVGDDIAVTLFVITR